MAKRKRNKREFKMIRKVYNSNGSFHIRIPMFLIKKIRAKHNDFFKFGFEPKSQQLILKKIKFDEISEK